MNLFELFIKIGVDDQASGKIDEISQKMGSGLKKAASVGITAITSLGTVVIKNFADFEQLAGGAGLMFGDAFETVMENAKNAYKTVQMSQNEYLQQVNGFATGLKTALGGNEQAAADLAHKIIQAEADVVAATGNSQEAVQNAFNGIMKSNFTMLDNLQIGITPTKEGFQEVIDKVNEWNAEMGNATNYQMDNLADMQSALVDYIDMVDMSGYAQDEASGTILGSFASMKAAASDFATSLIDKNASVGDAWNRLEETVVTFVDNIKPKIGEFLESISPIATTVAGITGAFVAFKTAASISALLSTLIASFQAYKIANEGATIAQWLMNAAMNANPIVLIVTLIAGLVAAIITLWNTNEGFRNALISAWEAIKSAANNIFSAVANFFKETIPNAFNSVIDWFKNVGKTFENIGKNIVTAIGNGIKSLASKAMTWAQNLINNFISGVKSLISKIMDVGKSVVNAVGDGIKSIASEALAWGKDMIDNFVSGIKSKISVVTSAVSKIASTVRSFLGFSEPEKGPLSNFHTFAPDMMNLFIKGIKDNEKKLTDQIEKTFDFGERTITAGISYSNYNDEGISSGRNYGIRRVSVVQNIYSEAKTAADLMQEALYQQERAVLLGV